MARGSMGKLRKICPKKAGILHTDRVRVRPAKVGLAALFGCLLVLGRPRIGQAIPRARRSGSYCSRLLRKGLLSQLLEPDISTIAVVPGGSTRPSTHLGVLMVCKTRLIVREECLKDRHTPTSVNVRVVMPIESILY